VHSSWGPTGDWGDVGRGLCANIDARYRGMECWAAGQSRLYAAQGADRGPRPNTPNMAIWWDADREREHISGTGISKWNGTSLENLKSASGRAVGNRDCPMGYGNVLGDWREEAWWLCNNNTELRIYVSTALTVGLDRQQEMVSETNEVTLRDDADECPVLFGYRHAPTARLPKELGDSLERRRRANGDEIIAHDAPRRKLMENRIFLGGALREPARQCRKHVAVRDDSDEHVPVDDRKVTEAKCLHVLLQHQDRIVWANREDPSRHEIAGDSRFAVHVKWTRALVRSRTRTEGRRRRRVLRRYASLGWRRRGP
jgi:hypothetical protein